MIASEKNEIVLGGLKEVAQNAKIEREAGGARLSMLTDGIDGMMNEGVGAARRALSGSWRSLASFDWRAANPLSFARERAARLDLKSSAEWWYENPELRFAARALENAALNYANAASPKALRQAKELAERKMEFTQSMMTGCWVWNGRWRDGRPPAEVAAIAVDAEAPSMLRAEAQGWAENRKDPRSLDALLAASVLKAKGALALTEGD